MVSGVCMYSRGSEAGKNQLGSYRNVPKFALYAMVVRLKTNRGTEVTIYFIKKRSRIVLVGEANDAGDGRVV